MTALRSGLQQVRRYPSALVGLGIIIGLIIVALVAVIIIPYNEAIRLWRGGEDIWQETPRYARPAWLNLFSAKKLPETIVVSTKKGAAKTLSGNTVTISLAFEYRYDDFPSEITLFLEAKYAELLPYATLRWRTPDGREIPLGERKLTASERYSISQDTRLERRLGDRPPEIGLFLAPQGQTLLKGRYELQITGALFEQNSDIDAKLIVYGKVYGLAGTDHKRRDLMIALLWGAPVALAFGFIVAVGTSLTTLIIAAIGAWYGRWIDALIQRITEVNIILPSLVILIIVGTFYSRSIWVMMIAITLLSIFTAGIKVYRAIFLQIKESPYIEAARAYGASDLRLIVRYMTPRVIPVLVPGFVTLIPGLVFLEASLGVLGLGDPVLPTWGKVLNDASANGALYKGYYYWVLGPSILLMVTALGFALLGFALDRIFNPRLREL
ncbi:MAG: ABC transporter permease [Candidatus Bipolaricaulia bacterium]